jgi:hypothetical protein
MNEQMTNAVASMTTGVGLVVTLVVAVAGIVALWKLFEKAGYPGWHSIIPFLIYDEFKMSWGNGWFFLLMLIPYVNFVIEILLSLKLAKSFGKSTGFAIGLIFLPTIFLLILGFDSSKYIGPNGVAAGADTNAAV